MHLDISCRKLGLSSHDKMQVFLCLYNQYCFVLCSSNIFRIIIMSSYSYKLKEKSDLCHYVMSSEKDYGVQAVILRENSPHNVSKVITEGKSCKDVVYLHVASPGKAFECFEQEKHKLIIAPKAYFQLLQFFHSDWPLVFKRLEVDYQSLKARTDWIALDPAISFRGPADIVYKCTLESATTFALHLVITKRIDNGKTNISLAYTDESMGSMHVPPGPMAHLAQTGDYLRSLYDYKEPVATKRSRQS
jgi:hypothetical protein